MTKPAFSERTKEEKKTLLIIRIFVVFFMGALIVSGATAFPLESELKLLCNIIGVSTDEQYTNYTGFQGFIAYVYTGITDTSANYPFLAYGTDWLAFAHIIIAIAFAGVFFKPVRNVWIVYWAMIACVAVIPTVIICGAVREIPVFWQLVDCSFGVFGMIPLLILLYFIKRLEKISCYVPSTH